MRDTERLVEVEVADVGAVIPRPTQPDLGVHVGAVQVDLAAVLVDEVADLGNRPLEDAVRARIRDHDAGQGRGVGLDLKGQGRGSTKGSVR